MNGIKIQFWHSGSIADAIGVRIKDLPITPDKILSALKKKA